MKTMRGPSRIVYVVDRDESVRAALRRLMDSADFEAHPCASVQEFLESAHWRQAACVLLEVSMLKDCDAAVNAALRSVAEVLPVIALSAMGTRGILTMPHSMASIREKSDTTQGNSVPSG